MATNKLNIFLLSFLLLILFSASNLFAADPVPADDTITFTVTGSNTKKTFNPRVNDTPTNGKISSFTSPDKGTVVRVNNNTKFKYTPDYNSVPYTATFTYKIEKNGIVSPTSATVTMNVEGNEAPIAVNDAVSMTRPDVSYIQFSPLGNDTPLDSGLKIKTVDTAEHGKTEIKNKTKIKYTPETDYVGTDSFTYTVKDTLGRISAAATVTVTVNGPEMPVAVNQTVSMTKPGSSYISIYPLDDCTPKDTGLKIETVSKGEHTDTLILNSSKLKITYTPDTDYVGTDSFTYTVKDKLGRISAAGTVTVNIIGPTPPIAFEETDYLIGNVRNVNVSVLENDTVTGINTVEVVAQPSNGTTSYRDDKTVIRYRRNDNFTSGTDSFTYKVLDAYNQPSNIVTVTIIVSSEPVAIADYVQVNSTLTKKIIDVLSNDKPKDNVTIESFTQPGHGSTKFNWTNTKIKYIPESSYTGEDQFTYKIKIGKGNNIRISEPATVYIYVGDLPDLTATSDTATVNSGSSVTIAALDNDTGIRSSVKHVATPSEGTVEISGDNIIYTAPQDYTGTVTFSYTIQSPFYSSDATGDIIVTVSSGGGGGPAEFANTANDILFAKMNNPEITWDILANDTGENLEIDSITPASHGTVTISNNMIEYTPESDYVGNDSFTYTNNNGDVTPAIVVVKPDNDYKNIIYTILGKALTLISEDITVDNRKLQDKMPTIEIVLYSNLIYGFYPTTNDEDLENISGEGLEDKGLKYLAELRGKLELADDVNEISEWMSEFNNTKATLTSELTAAKDTYNPN